jgi:predicted enzyme related to lactoylglutathione lyase
MPQEIHFDIPIQDPEQAEQFYGQLFGWTMQKVPVPNFDYWVIRASEGDALGGLIKTDPPQAATINYYTVPSIDEAISKVQELGGSITVSKTTIPYTGYNAQCTDTEGNAFGLWENNRDAR